MRVAGFAEWAAGLTVEGSSRYFSQRAFAAFAKFRLIASATFRFIWFRESRLTWEHNTQRLYDSPGLVSLRHSKLSEVNFVIFTDDLFA